MRRKAFEKYDQSSKDVMHALMGIRDRFWLTHKYDRRGRTYCVGYHINYQGTSWNKAVVEFANKEELNDD
jgi:DNA-directed RNA polymerase